jgi:hypothetical protein
VEQEQVIDDDQRKVLLELNHVRIADDCVSHRLLVHPGCDVL